jgi:predicted metal-dependent hydrolase
MGGRVTSVVVRGDAHHPAMRLVEVGDRLVELHIRRSARVSGHRIVVRFGFSPELVVRPRATEAEIDAAIAANLGWLERQLAKAAAPTLGLDRLSLTAEQGRREARARISLIAQSEAAALGVSYARISLRDQRSRWGSCSTTGTLSFNWRLVLAPHDVLDYVVVHEICHLVEMNHGPGFWALVGKRRPAYAEAKAWLDEHGWEILAYRPPEQIAA